MDIVQIIALIVLLCVAVTGGFFLGRWVVLRSLIPKLKSARHLAERSKKKLNEANTTLTISRKELSHFKKISAAELSKLTESLKQTETELTSLKIMSEAVRVQAENAVAGGVTGADGNSPIIDDHPTGSAALSDDVVEADLSDGSGSIDTEGMLEGDDEPEERRTDIRRGNEKRAANLVEEMLAVRALQESAPKEAAAGGHLDTADLGVDFFATDAAESQSNSQEFFKGSAFSADGGNRVEDQEALLIQYIEKARRQEEKITSLLYDNGLLNTKLNSLIPNNDEGQSVADADYFEEVVESEKNVEGGEAIKLRHELTTALTREEELQATMVSLQGQSKKYRQETRDAKEKISHLMSEIDSVVAQMREQDTVLDDTRKEALSLRKQKDNAEMVSAALRIENEQKLRDLSQLKEQHRALKSSLPEASEIVELKSKIEIQKNEILSLTRKLQAADRLNNDLQQKSLEIPKLNHRLEVISDLERQVNDGSAEIARLNQAQSALQEQNNELQLINSEYLHLEHKNEEVCRDNLRLQREVDRIPDIVKESQAAQAKLSNLFEEIERMRAAHVKVDEELAASKKELPKLDQIPRLTLELQTLQESNANLVRENQNLSELEGQIKELQERNDELLDQLSRTPTSSVLHTERQIERDKSEIDSVAADEVRRLQHELKALTVEADVLRTRNKELDATANVVAMQAAISEKHAKAAPGKNRSSTATKKQPSNSKKSVARNTGVKAGSGAQKQATKSVSKMNARKTSPSGRKVANQKTETRPSKKASVSSITARAKRSARSKRSAPIDDLKKINGIGPKLEALLHKQGITRFSDLASMTKAESVELAESLGSFGERVSRDKWIAKAKKLVKQTKDAA